jgi:hypothetical protein
MINIASFITSVFAVLDDALPRALNSVVVGDYQGHLGHAIIQRATKIAAAVHNIRRFQLW